MLRTLSRAALLPLAIPAAVLTTTPTTALAQSSLQMYGRIEAGIEYVTGQPTGANSSAAPTGSASRLSQESGDSGVSMFGIKASEDIGGGTRVQTHLELQFLADTGGFAGSDFFNRFATVGLSNERYGTLDVGHQLFISNAVWDFDPFGQSPWASASLTRGRNWPVINNAINYVTPKFGNFDAGIQYALSNATAWNGNGTTAQGRANGFYLTWTTPDYQVRGIYDEIRNPANGRLDDPFQYSREYTLAGNLFLGRLKLMAAWQASRAPDLVAPASGTPSTTNYVWGGASWQASPALSFTGAVYHINANNNAGNATMVGVGAAYKLSVRTIISTQFSRLHNSSTANFSMVATNGAGDSVASGNPPRGQGQSGAYVGIMHFF